MGLWFTVSEVLQEIANAIKSTITIDFFMTLFGENVFLESQDIGNGRLVILLVEK